MTEPPDPRDWTDVDSQDDPDQFAAYLEHATGAEVVQSYKQRSHGSLQLDAGNRVLDVGCGIGDDVLLLADIVGVEGRVVGVDNSETMISRARERGGDHPAIDFEIGDIYDLEYGRDRFDASRADRVLQHLESPSAALAELVRVTRPGGRIGLSDPDWESVVIDVPGDEKTREFLDPAYAPTRNPAQGRQLYRLAMNAELVDIEIDPIVFHSTSFEFAQRLGNIDVWLDNMGSAGIHPQREIDAWVDRIQRADEADQFFSALVGYTVTGTVPEPT